MRQVGVKAIGRTAFDAVYEKNVQIVYKTALYYSKNRHTAEEITQAVFMKLYVNMENINMEAVDSWLLVTAKHMALNHRRKAKRETIKEDALEIYEYRNTSESPEDHFMNRLREREHRELAETIFADLYQVNERWYDAVLLAYFLEKPQKEVAETMGIPLESLHSMLYRAKKWIRKNYEEQFHHLNKA